VSNFRARVERFEAPVDYGEVRPWLQRVRALVAGSLFIAWLVGLLFGAPWTAIPTVVTAAVLIHAVVRGPRPHTITEVLVVDALAIALVFSGPEPVQAPLIAAAAYLIAASVTFGGLVTLLWALTSFSLSITVVPYLPIPQPTTVPAAVMAIGWVAVAVFLGAVALSLMTAATEVFKAKRAQAGALETERKAAQMKTDFVSMVTHELRTPLTNIAGFTETLQEAWQELERAEVDEFLQIIMSESDHLKNLVEDLLAIPRLEAGKLLMEPTDFALRPAAFKVIDLSIPEGESRSAGVSIGSNVVVHADPNRVEQILRNLVENAIKYGGDTVAVEATPLDNHWQIVVSDNGTGLSDTDRARVFQA